MNPALVACFVDSPIGRIRVVADGAAITRIEFPGEPGPPAADGAGDPLLARAAAQLAEYFAGARRAFDLPLAPAGTPFQRAVWAALLRIPYGTTTSYAVIAAAIGRPAAVRAVGAANGRNPVPIVIPCHRVIGRDGSLTGYGGGLPIKERLLALEGALRAPTLAF